MFTHQERKLIATRVEQLKNKKAYKKIFKIIYENKDNYIINEKGIFIDLTNISNDILIKIKILLDDFDQNKPIIPVPRDFTSEESPRNINSRLDTSLLSKKNVIPKFESTSILTAINSESKNDINSNLFSLSLDN